METYQDVKFIELRRATMADARRLLKWKNDRKVRQWSIVSKKKIKMKNHLMWLKENIDTVSIITDGKNDYGNVRIADNEIAIRVSKGYRKRGVGNAVMKAVVRAVNSPKGISYLIAKIVDGNVASMRLFLKNGFKVIDHRITNKVGYYVLKYEETK